MVSLLAYPDPHRPCVLYTDANDTCIGACLTQKNEEEGPFISGIPVEKALYFLSHKLSPSHVKWSTIEKEAFAINFALQKLDHYLHNADFLIKMYHKPLKYLLDSPNEKQEDSGMGP